MTKQRKSARILALQGAYKKNPQRENKAEPEVQILSDSDIPEMLSDYERGIFKKLMSYMPNGVYTVAEIPLLTLACRLQAQCDLDWENFPATKIGHLSRCLSLLGMTPGDRTKLVQPNKAKPNKFDDF